MTPKQWAAVGALASISFAVAAQQAPDRSDPLDAKAAVPAPSYKSAFVDYQRAGNGQQPSADKLWRIANDEVAKPLPHATDAPTTTDAASPPEKAHAADHGKHHH